jgi:hypothetical protein
MPFIILTYYYSKRAGYLVTIFGFATSVSYAYVRSFDQGWHYTTGDPKTGDTSYM